ncbi:MAG: 50S ribosomal protein L30 [actinobacterium acAMD-5]|jgi:large subunit ribosomal protein L30|nr:MAG: 50S ribosomal protein L30 [actinobacterium acAMD-5]
MAKFQITQIKSDIGGTERQRQTLLSLGLRKIGDVSIKSDSPEFVGMLRKVAHLVRVEEVK